MYKILNKILTKICENTAAFWENDEKILVKL